MNPRKTKEWLDLVASIAVVLGLLLVAYEVRQANFLAKAHTENAIYEGWEVLSMSEIATGINAIYLKSIDRPESLTQQEIEDLGSWLVAVVSLYSRNGRLFHEYGLATDPTYFTIGPDYFASRHSRDWFEENEAWIRLATPMLADVIRDYIESTPIKDAATGPAE